MKKLANRDLNRTQDLPIFTEELARHDEHFEGELALSLWRAAVAFLDDDLPRAPGVA